MSASPFDALVEIFLKFPGIGPRQAKRFVYFLLSLDQSSLNNFIDSIKYLKDSSSVCSRCNYHFFSDSHNKLCSLCNNPQRDHSSLMVVEKDLDVDNIKKADSYTGLFYILGGLVPILEKNPSHKVKIIGLKNLIQAELKTGQLKEIILALSVNPEGDYTVDYLKTQLAPLLSDAKIHLSVLGRGLSTGTELEYSDSETLRNALRNRHDI